MEGRKERTMEGRRKDRRVEEGGMEHTSQHPEAMEDPTSAGTQCCCAAAPPPHLHAGTQHCCWALQMWVSCAALAPPGPNCAAADRTQWVKRPHSPHPHVPISPPPHVPISPHPPIPISPIPLSQYPPIPLSPRPYIPISPHPHVPTSPHPHIPPSPYPNIPPSPRPPGTAVGLPSAAAAPCWSRGTGRLPMMGAA